MMAVNVLRDIAGFIQKAKFFSLMADEVTDSSNKEQVIVCLRSVDENFEPHEDFFGIHAVESIKADILVGGPERYNAENEFTNFLLACW